MRRPLLAIVTILVAAAAGAAGPSRTLTLEQPSAGLSGIVVKAGIGDVEIVAQDGPSVSVEVEITARHVRFFGSSGGTAVENAEIAAERTGSTLHLEITTPHHDDHGFSERWTIRMPAALAARLKLGVGDIRVLDTLGALDLEVGVGDVRIESAFDGFGAIRASAGVGDVKLRTPSGRETGEGFISKSLDSRGGGTSEINAHAGVGDIDIRLR